MRPGQRSRRLRPRPGGALVREAGHRRHEAVALAGQIDDVTLPRLSIPERLAQSQQTLFRPHLGIGSRPLRPSHRTQQHGIGTLTQRERGRRHGLAGGVDGGAAEQRMLEFIDNMAPLLQGPPEAREKTAWRALSLMVGAMLIARAMPDQDQAARVIDTALESALESSALRMFIH